MSRVSVLEGQQISILGGHTISPELAQVAAILERLIEHQESKILALLVLQKPVRLPLKDRVHGEPLPMREYRRKIWRGRREEEGRLSLRGVASLFSTKGDYL